jgi:hypothetical protein
VRQKQHKNQQRKRQPPPWWAPPKTRGEAVKQSYLETRPEYLPVKRQLRREIKASAQREGEVGDWWNQYLQTVSGVQGETQKAYADAAAQTQGMISQSSTIDSAATKQLTDEAAASAALRGQTAPTTALTDRANAAQAQRNYLSSAAGGATAQRGANQFAYLADKRRIGAGQRVKSMMDESARGRSIKQDLMAAKKEQGAQAVKNLNTMRDRYREELLKRQAFGLEKKQTALDAAEGAADRALDEAKFNESKRHNRASEGDAAVDNRRQERERKEGKGGGGNSEAREGRQAAMAAARNLVQANGVPQTQREWAGLEALVRQESEISPQEAAWAVRRLRNRYSGGGTGAAQGGVHR